MTLVYLGEVLGAFIDHVFCVAANRLVHTYNVHSFCVKYMFVCHLQNKTLKQVLCVNVCVN